MRKILLLAFCLITHFCYAQVILSQGLQGEYNKAVKTISAGERELVLGDNSDFKDMGFGIFSICKVDTLNKSDLIRETNINVHIFDIDTDKITGKIIKTEMVNHNVKEDLIPLVAKLNGDTLWIADFVPFGSGFSHKLINRKVKTFYNAYQKHDNIFRLKLKDPKTDDLNIPVKDLSFKLSSLKFKPGQILYGEADFLTSPFYEDNEQFKTGYIEQRIHCKYIFKIKVTEDYAK